jgi:hypothetical protein
MNKGFVNIQNIEILKLMVCNSLRKVPLDIFELVYNNIAGRFMTF